jgi:hypothetical protein
VLHVSTFEFESPAALPLSDHLLKLAEARVRHGQFASVRDVLFAALDRETRAALESAADEEARSRTDERGDDALMDEIAHYLHQSLNFD